MEWNPPGKIPAAWKENYNMLQGHALTLLRRSPTGCCIKRESKKLKISSSEGSNVALPPEIVGTGPLAEEKFKEAALLPSSKRDAGRKQFEEGVLRGRGGERKWDFRGIGGDSG